ncbi:MAG: hypothetical protein MR033_07820 [Clostridiales bacterium]|nr:hypothetical protein [Clostridiales bacterium]
MLPITPPKYVKQVLLKLESREFGAYLVGGCVRDLLLGIRPADWDVCTNALPEEIMEIFPNCRDTGSRCGTVTVYEHGHAVEVTTFRTETGYSDHRRPDSVVFTADLTGDLQRRDFTINAIALPLAGIVVDPYDGRADLERGVIRCVGDPMLRMGEDALRLFRAFRFAARFGFAIEPDTLEAIRARAYLCPMIAPERIRTELEKTLLTAQPETVQDMIDAGLLDHLLDRRGDCVRQLRRIALLPKHRQRRWAALCCVLEENRLIGSAEQLMRALRMDAATTRAVSLASSVCRMSLPKSRYEWKRLLSVQGVESALCCAAAADTLFGGCHTKLLRSVLKSGECFSLKRLAVTGDDLLQAGFRGPAVGTELSMLLEHVLREPSSNERETLLALASKNSCNGAMLS